MNSHPPEWLQDIIANTPFPDLSGNLTVRVIDRPCGSGKSTSLIEKINNNPEKSWLIVVPLLSEIDRFLEEVNYGLDEPILFQPLDDTGIAKSKTEHMNMLMKKGKSIVTTHAMLSRFNDYWQYLGHYDVVIDEVPDFIEQYNTKVTHGDWKGILQPDNLVSVDPDTGELDVTDVWKERSEFYAQNDQSLIKKFLEDVATKHIYFVTDTYFITHVPKNMFTLSKSTTIMTFLFEGTKLQNFFDKLGINYHHDVDHDMERDFKKKTAELLTIKQHRSDINCAFGKATGIRSNVRREGSTWLAAQWRRMSGDYRIDDVLIVSAKSAWFGVDSFGTSMFKPGDTFKYNTRLANATWLPSITRGTNDYSDSKVMFYLHNENMHPNMAQFLNMTDYDSKQKHAVSEMLQVIYRTAIRKGEPVVFACPDQRSIQTLTDWLDS